MRRTSIEKPTYRIRRSGRPPAFSGDWSEGVWAAAEALRVDHFHAASSEHRPEVQAKLLYDDACLYVIFRVRDRYVRAVIEEYQGPVCTDSCVEAFLQPGGRGGYFNFELNCCGTLLLYYIEDPRRTEEGFVRSTSVAPEHAADIRIYHSMPDRVDPEIAEAVQWRVEYGIPFDLFEAYIGNRLDFRKTATWRGNFYKCGDKTSHPHWASWSPIGEELNFHCPQYFGVLEFEV